MKKILFLFVVILIFSCKSDNNVKSIDSKDYFGNFNKIEPITENSMISKDDWYKNATFYHIWVNSFNDSDDDDYGDIRGIIDKLDYLNDGNPNTHNDLGVTAIWLSPIFDCYGKSPSMHGYDTVDYYKINNLFGTEEDVVTLLKEAHKRGIRVIFDYVPNLVCMVHPWFLDAVNGGKKRNWFIWEQNPSKEWEQAWGGGKWTNVWHKTKKGYYYGAYSRFMPDLNFNNKEVRQEMANVLIYWLNKGFDGIRVDSARYIFEDGPKRAADVPRTHDFYKQMRAKILNEYSKFNTSKMMVAEVWSSSEIIRKYYGDGNDEFNMSFDFPLTNYIRATVKRGEKSEGKILELDNYLKSQIATYPQGFRSGTFLSNHDLAGSRPFTDYDGDIKKCIIAQCFNLLLPGTPFIYYGNEIAMPDGKMKGDGKMRTKMEWNVVEKQNLEKDSVLSWTRYLVQVRNTFDAIRNGSYQKIKTSNPNVFAFLRSIEGESVFVVINFKNEKTDVYLDFTDTKIKEDAVSLIIGTNYNGDTSIVGEKYKNFLINNIPPKGIRVYSVGSDKQLIAKDIE